MASATYTASVDDQRRAWKKCYLKGALKHHPDKNGDEETFKKLGHCNDLMEESHNRKDKGQKAEDEEDEEEKRQKAAKSAARRAKARRKKAARVWTKRTFPLTWREIVKKKKYTALYGAFRIMQDLHTDDKFPQHFIIATTKKMNFKEAEVYLYFDPSNSVHRGLVRTALQKLGRTWATRENLPGETFKDALSTEFSSGWAKKGYWYVVVPTTPELAQSFQDLDTDTRGVTRSAEQLYEITDDKLGQGNRWHFWRLKHDDVKEIYRAARYLSKYLRKEDTAEAEKKAERAEKKAEKEAEKEAAAAEAKEKIQKAQEELEQTFCKKNLDAYVDALRKDYTLSFPSTSTEKIDEWVKSAKEWQIPDKRQEFIYLKPTDTGVDTQFREFLRNVWEKANRPLKHIKPKVSRLNPNYAVEESRRYIGLHSNDPTTQKARLAEFDRLVANKDKWFTECLGFESLKTEVLEPLRTIIRETVEEWTAADKKIAAQQAKAKAEAKADAQANAKAEAKAKVTAQAFQTRFTTLQASEKPPGPKVAKMYSVGLAWTRLPAAEQKQKAKRALGILRRLNTT